MSMPLDGALYISNGRRRGTSTPRVLSGLGDLMAFTISNPFFSNRRKRRKSTATKIPKRGKGGRFVKGGASKSKARSKALGKGKRTAAKRRAEMTKREVAALARKMGLVVRPKKKRKISGEQQAKMRTGRKEAAARRHTVGLQGAGMVPIGPVMKSGAFGAPGRHSTHTISGEALEDFVPGLAANGRRRRRGSKRRATVRRTRRNGLLHRNPAAIYDRALSVVEGLPMGLGVVGYTLATAASAAALHVGAAKVLNFAADYSPMLRGALNYVAPVGFTLAGATVRFALPYVLDLSTQLPWGIGGFFDKVLNTFISKNALLAIGNAAVATGAALDVYRYFKGTSSTYGALNYGALNYGALNYGDGMAYEVVPYANQYSPAAIDVPLALPAPSSPTMNGLNGLNYAGLEYGGIVYAGEGM